jgi:RHS repeat-associated protein
MAFAEGTVAEQGKQPYKYNGKELDQMHGLNWYDSNARFYDPAIGRTPTIDPHAENYYSWSPYAWVGNNPLRNIDPDGKDWFVNNENGNVFFIRGLSDLSKISQGDANFLAKNGIDISNTAIYENLGDDNMIEGVLGGYIPWTEKDGWDYSKQFMAENGFVSADKVTVEEESSRNRYMEVDGGLHYSEPVTSSKELNRVKNSYAKPDDLYQKTNSIHKYASSWLTDEKATTSSYKVPAGAPHNIPRNSNVTEQQRQQDRRQNIFQTSLELVKVIVTTIF